MTATPSEDDRSPEADAGSHPSPASLLVLVKRLRDRGFPGDGVKALADRLGITKAALTRRARLGKPFSPEQMEMARTLETELRDILEAPPWHPGGNGADRPAGGDNGAQKAAENDNRQKDDEDDDTDDAHGPDDAGADAAEGAVSETTAGSSTDAAGNNDEDDAAEAEADENDEAAFAASQREYAGRDGMDAGGDQAPLSEGGPRPPKLSDDGIALTFAARYAADFRYVAKWGKWMLWDGQVWREDETLLPFHRARMVCRAVAAGEEAKVAKALTSAKTEAAVANLTRSDRQLAATTRQWDTHPWLFNTPGGMIDLKTGGTQAHDAGLYLTQMAAIAPLGICPGWMKFLDVVTGGDVKLQEFLQRLCGYCLTGVTIEHMLAFIYGTGANGKSVFLSTVSGILGDYHKTASIETFTTSKMPQHPTDLAGLRGARLVTAIETEEGRQWAESKIKALTGGDRIAARFMRQDFFEYTPQFKLVIAGNHKPGLSSIDEAIRRRFHLIPFTVTIPPKERDPDLAEKLRVEWPGILQWALAGCLQWRKTGLAPPPKVVAATEAYLNDQDTIANWLDECCDLDPNVKERTSALFDNWADWARRSGAFVGERKQFRERLEARGFIPGKDSRTRQSTFKGLRLKPELPPTDAGEAAKAASGAKAGTGVNDAAAGAPAAAAGAYAEDEDDDELLL